MKVVVTGASGFLGSRLVARLANLGHEIIAVSRTAPSDLAAAHPEVRWLLRDIARDGIESLEIASAEAIVHLAAAKDPRPGEDERMLIETNELLTSRLARAVGRDQKLIFASSQMVYGDPGHLAVTEDFPLLGMDSSPYACSKLNAENWLRCLRKQSTCLVLRFCGFIEGGGNMDYIIDRALRNEPIVLHSEGKVRRDYLTAAAGVEACVLALRYAAPRSFETFNIGSGQPIATAELARLIRAELGSRSDIVLSQQLAPRADFIFNIDKAHQHLGFDPGSLPEAVLRYTRHKLAVFNRLQTHG